MHPTKPWYSCLDCQKVDFKGWPTVEEGLPFEVPLDDDHRDAMLAKCTRKPKRSLRDMEYSGLLDDDDNDDEKQGGEDDGISQALTTTQYDDEDDDNSSTSSQDSEELKHDTIVSILTNVLGCGIASVCRLRQLFPPSFFHKMDVGGTTVTKFNKDAIKAICNNKQYYSQDDDDDEEEDDDEGSMVKSFNARKTQTELSPLTEFTQRQRKSHNAREHVEYNDNEKRLATEALLLLKWTENDGVGAILESGNLANVVFGVCVPSTESGSTNDDLLESYSVSISGLYLFVDQTMSLFWMYSYLCHSFLFSPLSSTSRTTNLTIQVKSTQMKCSKEPTPSFRTLMASKQGNLLAKLWYPAKRSPPILLRLHEVTLNTLKLKGHLLTFHYHTNSPNLS